MRRQIRQASRVPVAGDEDAASRHGSASGRTVAAAEEDVPSKIGDVDERDPFKQLVTMYRELDAKQATTSFNGWLDGKHKSGVLSSSGTQDAHQRCRQSAHGGGKDGYDLPAKGGMDDEFERQHQRCHHRGSGGSSLCGDESGYNGASEEEDDQAARRQRELRKAEALERWSEAKRRAVLEAKRQIEQEEEQARQKEEQQRAEEAARQALSEDAVREWKERKEVEIRRRREAELAKKQAVRDEVEHRKQQNEQALRQWIDKHKPENDRRSAIRYAAHTAPWDDNFGGALDIQQAPACDPSPRSEEEERHATGPDRRAPMRWKDEELASYTWEMPCEKGRAETRKVQVNVRQPRPANQQSRSTGRNSTKCNATRGSCSVAGGGNGGGGTAKSGTPASGKQIKGGSRNSSAGRRSVNSTTSSIGGSPQPLFAHKHGDSDCASGRGQRRPSTALGTTQKSSSSNLNARAGSAVSSRRSSRISNYFTTPCSHVMYSVAH